MKNFYTILLIFIFYNSKSQNIQFVEVSNNSPFSIENIFGYNIYGAMNHADIDNDNDEDVLIVGMNEYGEKVANLFINDGTGNFLLDTNTTFEGVDGYYNFIEFADVDNDNDLDIIIAGKNSIEEASIKLYLNDGSGSFNVDNTFDVAYNLWSVVGFLDVDNDNDQDILIGSSIYKNNGAGEFSYSSNFDNTGKMLEAEFGDFDMDLDIDILIRGTTNGTHIFTNDGTGIFSLNTDSIFESVYGFQSSITTGDVDADGDIDILLSGRNVAYDPITKLYLNDGTGIFVLDNETNLENTKDCHIEFADIDNDTDIDILITGTGIDSTPVSEIYFNDGSGNFSNDMNHTFTDISESIFTVLDIDNDNDLDIIFNIKFYGLQEIQILVNDGNGKYSLVTETPFIDVNYSDIGIADVDNDNDEDVLIAGEDNLGRKRTCLYENDGSGIYSLDQDNSFINIKSATIEFADYDKDNDMDVLIVGQLSFNNTEVSTELYNNDGTGLFSIVSTPFVNTGNTRHSIVFNDLNNDQYPDVLLTGQDENFNLFTNLYINDGTGNFISDSSDLVEDNYSVIAFDVDNDNDLDIQLFGYDSNLGYLKRLYINDNNGNFVLFSTEPWEEISQFDVNFADLDNDGDYDYILQGANPYTNELITKLYLNDGEGNFISDETVPFENVYNGSIAVADIDNDLDQDLLITGTNVYNEKVSNLYINNGTGNFSLETGLPFEKVSSSDVKFVDFNKDDKIDVIITGWNGQRKVTKLYRNETQIGVNDIDFSHRLKLYPNPSNGMLHLKNAYFLSNIHINIKDVQGNLLKKIDLLSSDQPFLIESESGLYLIEVISDQYIDVFKVIKM